MTAKTTPCRYGCTIGLWSDEPNTLMRWEDLKEQLKIDDQIEWTLKEYADWRYNTNLIRFAYCPWCGAEIDWDSLRKDTA